MFALGIRYLTGSVVASEPDLRERPEWPPHPARVFMALAAAHFQTAGEADEREVLRWLEALPAPSIRASSAAARSMVTHYVPVNDKPGEKTKPPTAIIQSAPQLARDRQPRTFARAWLDDDTVYLVWPDVIPDDRIVKALGALCSKVTRVGHSTSLVQMWVVRPEEVGDVNWVPDEERAEVYLRVTGPGLLEDLERRYNADAVERYVSLVVAAEGDSDRKVQREARRQLREEFGGGPPERSRPQISLYQGYSRPRSEGEDCGVTGSVFSPHLIVFGLERRSGPFSALGLRAAPALVQRWREALVGLAHDVPGRIREIVSGHAGDGAPLQEPHLAFLPLAFVGHPHADGHLLGLAACLPTSVDVEQRRRALQVLGRVEELRLGNLGVWRLARDLGDRPPWNLRSEAWTAYPDGATHWSTVTPVAFDRHPKERDRGAYQRAVTEMMKAGCEAVGLPRPREVVVTPVSAHLGVPPAHVFPRLQRKDGTDRRHSHAILIFGEPVRGPVLLGAGRYRGYGVCRPLAGGARS